jgi:hypothetical protein
MPLDNPAGATQMRPAHAWTAAAFVLGGISLYVAAIASPELAMSFSDVLSPKWVSIGYPPHAVPPGKLRQTLTLFAIFCFAIGSGWHLAAMLLRENATRVYRVALTIAAALIGACIWFFGNRHFGGVDQSLAIDVGWRLVRGQQPYRDFICTLPPGFFLPPKWAFQLLGVSWSSLVMLTAAFGAITFVWQALLLRKLLVLDWASLAVAAAFQSLAIVIASFWWYNPLTTVAGVIYVLSALVLLREPPRAAALCSYTLALVLLASVKPNVAGLLIAFGTLILLTSKALRVRILACSAIAFASFVGILWLQSISLPDLLRSYLSIAGRGAPSVAVAFHDVNGIERIEALIAVLLALSPLAFLRPTAREIDWRRAALLVLSSATGVYAILAHGELKYVDTPFLLLPVVLAVLTPIEPRPHARQWTLAVCLTLIAVGTSLGAMRHRIERIGFGAFFEWELDPRTPQLEFFRSLRTGPHFHNISAQINGVLNEAGAARVYFGTRLESFYAATNRDSPTGFPPLVWHRNTFHPLAREPEILDHFRRGDFDVLIFLRRDFTYFPHEIVAPLQRNYVLSEEHVRRYPNLTVLFLARRYQSAAREVAKLRRDEVTHRLREAGVNADP